MRYRHRFRSDLTRLAAFFAIAIFATPVSWGQTPPSGQPGVPPEQMDPPSENTVPPVDPNLEGAAPREPLSEKLKRGEGVLEPPRSIDPGIKKPVPEDFESKTPVIPPEKAEPVPKDAEPK